MLLEKLGDRDLQKHYVYLYQHLLKSIGINLLYRYAVEFIDTYYGMLST